MQGGDILRIDRAGWRWTDHFEMLEPLSPFYGNWRSPRRRGQELEWYWEALKGVAASCGYGPDDLEALRRQGYTTDEMCEMRRRSVAAVQVVNFQTLRQVIDRYAPRGLFLALEGRSWTAVDNSTGHAWTEEFRHKGRAVRWLRGELTCTGERFSW